MPEITIREFLTLCNEERKIPIELVCGESGLENKISRATINRPGLSLIGFVEHFANERIQIFGNGETSFIKKLENENRESTLDNFFGFDIPCCIFTYNVEIPKCFREKAENNGITVLRTPLSTAIFTSNIVKFLDDVFAPRASIHGVLVEVFGVGVLLHGKSGVGKSECALELIERGHRLIADDVINIKQIGYNVVEGMGPNLIQHHMEIRGVGIININKLFGAGAVRERKRIELVVQLEEWDNNKEYDRLGLEEKVFKILGVELPYLLIPVRPGRNIPIIVETASMNYRLKKMGYNSAKEFNKKLMGLLESETSIDHFR